MDDRYFCHLSVKKDRFPDNLPRCQACLADQLSRISWRCIDFGALNAGKHLIAQIRAILYEKFCSFEPVQQRPEQMRQNATSCYVRGQSAESASQAKSAKLSGTNAPEITINDTCKGYTPEELVADLAKYFSH